MKKVISGLICYALLITGVNAVELVVNSPNIVAINPNTAVTLNYTQNTQNKWLIIPSSNAYLNIFNTISANANYIPLASKKYHVIAQRNSVMSILGTATDNVFIMLYDAVRPILGN